jgi:hypothetical protein
MAEEAEEFVNRRFSLSCQLASGRVALSPCQRLFLAHVLGEHKLSTENIVGIAVDRKGIVNLVVRAIVANQAVNMVRELCPLVHLEREIQDLVERAELGKKDSEWLRSLPGVEDLRKA